MGIMNELFAGLEEGGISYVHFKSNRNLDKSFEAGADFDVLIDRRKLSDAERVIISCGGKRHNNARFGAYPGVDNWLIFDGDSGDIFHLHLHCQLATGKRLIKDYIIPWDRELLETRVRDERFGIYVSKPEAELLLLTVRAAVKKRSTGAYFPYGMEDERKDLAERADEGEVASLASRLLFADTADDDEGGDTAEGKGAFLAKVVMSDSPSGADMARIETMVRQSLEPFRRMSRSRAAAGSAFDYLSKILRKRINSHFGGYLPTAKTPHTSGALVAFVGIDGAGKSTVVSEIYKWLRHAGIDCRRTYMGIGDGRTTLYTRLVKKAGGKKRPGGSGKNTADKRVFFRKDPVKYIKRLFKLSIVYDVEKNNRKKLILMNRYRLNGGICICDRFPQIETQDRNDGPKAALHKQYLGDTVITRAFERRERRLLSIVKRIKPDLVFRLTVPPQVGLERKGDEINEASIKAHENKLAGLLAITYQGAPIVDIDTSMPFEEELLMIKRELWRYV